MGINDKVLFIHVPADRRLWVDFFFSQCVNVYLESMYVLFGVYTVC